MIRDKASIIAVLNCAEYLNQMQVSALTIKQMIYSQLKDYSFVDIMKIADAENIDMLFLSLKTDNDDETENEKKQAIQKKRNIKRVREGKS